MPPLRILTWLMGTMITQWPISIVRSQFVWWMQLSPTWVAGRSASHSAGDDMGVVTHCCTISNFSFFLVRIQLIQNQYAEAHWESFRGTYSWVRTRANGAQQGSKFWVRFWRGAFVPNHAVRIPPNQLYHCSNEHIIYSSDIWNAVINKEDATVDFINERQSPYFAQPRRTLLSTALQYIPKEGVISNNVTSLLHIIDASQVKRLESCDVTNISFTELMDQHSFNSFQGESLHNYDYILMMLQLERLASSQRQDYISECCCLAAMIYWRVLSTNVPFLSPDNQSIADQLVISLRHTDLERWKEHAPEMHIWVSYMGALASVSRPQRASFLVKSKISVVVLNPERLLYFQDGVSHILCLSRYLRHRSCTSEVIDISF